MKDTLFICLLRHDNKGAVLAEQISGLQEGRISGDMYAVVPESFRQVPNTPFCYWAGKLIKNLWNQHRSIVNSGYSVDHGMATKQDFRFLRLWIEVSPKLVGKDNCWVPYAKGGEYSRYYSDIHIIVDWRYDGRLIHEFLCQQYPYLNRNTDWILHPECSYYTPGLTYSRRTQKGFSARILPKDCRFDKNGPTITCSNDNVHLLALLGCINSFLFSELLNMVVAFGSYESGIVSQMPCPLQQENNNNQNFNLANKVLLAWSKEWSLDSANELSHAFILPSLLKTKGTLLSNRILSWWKRVEDVEYNIAQIQAEIDKITFDLYGFSEEERKSLDIGWWSVGSKYKLEAEEKQSASETGGKAPNNSFTVISKANRQLLTAYFLSWCIGVVLGRFDIRHALDSSLIPDAPDPFDPLPVCSPGMLMGPDGLPAKPGQIVSEEWLRARPDAGTLPPEGSVKNPTISDDEYPIRISWDGILVDDPGFNGGQPHRDDIVRRVREVLELLWGNRAQAIEEEACEILGVSELREYFRKPSGFFQDHLKRYSKSRRKAPIYWPLSTASGSYTVWLYYHRLNDQTLFAVVNKYMEPKIAEVERAMGRLESELAEGAGRGAASLRDRLNEGRALLVELQELREELLRVAGLPYKPNLNDGVIITAAPLHKLFRLRSWAKDTKSCWEKLGRGDYDWAHLAYTLWPERVKEVCRRDRSIAIAHGLEDLCEINPR